jgi:copper oxidase (laccase) domain-containing protein
MFEIEPAVVHATVPDIPSLAAQQGRLPRLFDSIYVQRNVGAAPELSNQFDEHAQAIYGGLDPKTVFFPPLQRENYPDESPKDLAAIADALNEHGAQSLRAARMGFRLHNVEWLGLASKADQVIIDNGAVTNKDNEKIIDDLGYFRRSPQTDVGVVGPRREDEQSITLAMGVADCLAIPIVDVDTEAFGFAHAGRPGTGLRTAEKVVHLLGDEFGSSTMDLVAFLGEGVCKACYTIDEKTYNNFVADFGGRTEIDKVISQYPEALQIKQSAEGERIAIDLYAFNKYLLAARGVGEIIVAPNCTARVTSDCQALQGHQVPDEASQLFFSHERVKGETVSWTTQTGHVIDLSTYHLTTPRNLAAITRY